MPWNIPPSGESQYAVALKLLIMIAEVEGWKVPNIPNSWNVDRTDILGTYWQCLAATGLPPPATQEWVSVPGILRGEAGDETRCTVRALKVGLPGTGAFPYARCSIEQVEGKLLEGRYEVQFANQVNAMQFRGGHWLQA